MADHEDTFGGYQEAVRALAVYPGQESNNGLFYIVLALAGKSGECADALRAIMRDGATVEGHTLFIEKAGDTLRVLADLCTELGVSLGDVAEGNLDKLRSRFDAGTLRGE